MLSYLSFIYTQTQVCEQNIQYYVWKSVVPEFLVSDVTVISETRSLLVDIS